MPGLPPSLALAALACALALVAPSSAQTTMAGIVKRASNDDGSEGACDLVHVDVETGTSRSVATVDFCTLFASAFPSAS